VGSLPEKKLAKLLDQYFGPNGTCEEVAVGTVESSDVCYYCTRFPQKGILWLYPRVGHFVFTVSAVFCADLIVNGALWASSI